ncbi:TRAP transporter substrate-binding protein DctP [Halomonas heilongjiangensis]|uniref:C4-dicarboxylate ABC transporter substrate-binding protein n=1 Tax=Halomonas heilongjiangensis TaxID=1387883 RepID=A0A2N7TFW4_9GAMM|nr:TRAP transporter substrate-binding protein DctP [Halomonas heilongjiangensis]PMR67076.1 hypothetical protein C1H66_20550 [Halomonas heilongjiangensis]PXX87813.1 hypothetical protein CR158_15810 [Halomonas heilongjiangensis]
MKTITTVLAAALLTLSAGTVQAMTQVRMLKTWDDRYPGSTVICDRYAELLEEASNGEIKVQMMGPETIPPLEQLEPTRNGLFQVLCTYPGFHTGSATLLTGLESIRPDAEAFRESGAMDVIQETYASLGVHAISVPLGHGYWIYLNRDLSSRDDLSGLQIRALPPQHPYISAIGGTPVVMSPAEMFSALERGVVDGALFPAAGAAGYGFAEVTHQYFDAGATAPHIIVANAAFWNALPEEVRAIFEAQAEVLEHEVPATYDRLNAEEHDKMAAAGMERLTLNGEVADTLSEAIVSGAWSFAASRNPDAAEELRAIVEAAGLLSN